MTAPARLPIHMSLQDFLAWESGDGLRYELIDGLPRAMAPRSTIHGFLQNELGSLIRDHLRAQRSDCAVIANPGVVPPVLSDRNMRVPDLGVTCTPLRPGQPTLADPVLLVEILSPGNQAKTWSNVWAYTSIKSVQEILVLHSGRIAADILRRSPEGAWPERTDQITGGDLILTSIAFRTPLAELYARTGLSA